MSGPRFRPCVPSCFATWTPPLAMGCRRWWFLLFVRSFDLVSAHLFFPSFLLLVYLFCRHLPDEPLLPLDLPLSHLWLRCEVAVQTLIPVAHHIFLDMENGGSLELLESKAI